MLRESLLHEKSKNAELIQMSSCPGNDCALDAEELLQMRSMCQELKKEKEMLRESLLHEKSKNAELIQRLESDVIATSGAHYRDKKYIELEKELSNCSQEIEYLQDQLKLRDVEANCIGEHVHSLELKLADVGKLHERLRLLSEELTQSDSQRLIVMQELRCREEELQNSALHIEKLEAAALDSQCEIESMKLDITALEQRCIEAESFSQQAAQEQARMAMRLEEFGVELQQAQQIISCLDNENTKLRENLIISESIIGSFSIIEEHLERWKKQISRSGVDMAEQATQTLLLNLRNEIPLPKEMGIIEGVLGRFLSKLAAVGIQEEDKKDEMEKMLNQIHESELLVKQLKEELREEKLKAKEEAEDLTQEMAELRYQIMGMLDEESRRRASIEEASIRRIQDLEAQVRDEQKKSSVALQRYHKAREIVEMQSMEVRKLKKTLKGLQQGINMEEVIRTIDSCTCGNCITLQNQPDCMIEEFVDDKVSAATGSSNTLHSALIEWHPYKSREDKNENCGSRTIGLT